MLINGISDSRIVKDPPNARIKTTVATFRMRADRIKSLQNEAAKERLTMNALVNKIVATYIDYHKPASEADMMYFPKKPIMSMLNCVPENLIDNLAEATESEITDFVYMKDNHHDADAVLKALMTWMSESGFVVSVSSDSSKHVIVTKHDMGINMSLLLSRCFQKVLEETNRQITVETRNDSVILTIE